MQALRLLNDGCGNPLLCGAGRSGVVIDRQLNELGIATGGPPFSLFLANNRERTGKDEATDVSTIMRKSQPEYFYPVRLAPCDNPHTG